MVGIIILAALMAFLSLILYVTRYFVEPLPLHGLLRLSIQLFVVFLSVSLLFFDEIEARFRFRKICAENASLIIDEKKIYGRTVIRLVTPEVGMAKIKDLPVDVYYFKVFYLDYSTKEILAKYSYYRASAGWFIRTVSASADMPPLIIRPTSCSGNKIGDLGRIYNFNVISPEE